MSLLSKDRTIAPPSYSRWMIPPAALCVHLCIGQAYAFSVFNLPMTKLLGITQSTPDDWKLTDLGWIFSLAIFVLGVSAALLGRWVEDGGPRKAMFTAALCWSGAFLISAFGVYIHNIWVIYFGYGIVGGFGLGIAYISPVSTLIKWFPDRPGMATGIAETFIALAVIYGFFMLVGSAIVRIPAPGWKPEGWTAPAQPKKLVTTRNVFVYDALKTPQFWLIWWVLCLNVTAGIGVLGQASAMSQEMFPGRVSVTAAAGFVGLMSLFNMGGRFFWASMSDLIGRKATYYVFFVLGAALYAMVPYFGSIGSIVLFVLAYGVIFSMYGGGFATVPAYLRDMFGMRYVGAIHGMLLTAWSMAGIFGPVLVNYIRQYNVDHGVAKAQAYNVTMDVMAVLLIVGFICNYFVKPVHGRHHMTQEADAMGVAD